MQNPNQNQYLWVYEGFVYEGDDKIYGNVAPGDPLWNLAVLATSQKQALFFLAKEVKKRAHTSGYLEFPGSLRIQKVNADTGEIT